jgi:hypothetical protein
MTAAQLRLALGAVVLAAWAGLAGAHSPVFKGAQAGSGPAVRLDDQNLQRSTAVYFSLPADGSLTVVLSAAPLDAAASLHADSKYTHYFPYAQLLEPAFGQRAECDAVLVNVTGATHPACPCRVNESLSFPQAACDRDTADGAVAFEPFGLVLLRTATVLRGSAFASRATPMRATVNVAGGTAARPCRAVAVFGVEDVYDAWLPFTLGFTIERVQHWARASVTPGLVGLVGAFNLLAWAEGAARLQRPPSPSAAWRALREAALAHASGAVVLMLVSRLLTIWVVGRACSFELRDGALGGRAGATLAHGWYAVSALRAVRWLGAELAPATAGNPPRPPWRRAAATLAVGLLVAVSSALTLWLPLPFLAVALLAPAEAPAAAAARVASRPARPAPAARLPQDWMR